MKSKSLQDLDAMRKKLADIAKAQKLAEQAKNLLPQTELKQK